MPCSIALDENLYLVQLYHVCRLSSSRLGLLWWWQQVGRSVLALEPGWAPGLSALSQHGVCCTLGTPFFLLLPFRLASLILLSLARGVGSETEQTLSSHHVLKHSGDSGKLATLKLYTLSALELGLKGPRTAVEPSGKAGFSILLPYV